MLGILGPSQSRDFTIGHFKRALLRGLFRNVVTTRGRIEAGDWPTDCITSDSYCYLLGPIIYLFHGWHEAESCMNNNQANNIFYTTFEQKYKWKSSMMGKIVNDFGSHQVSIEVKIIIGVGYWMWVKRAGTIMGWLDFLWLTFRQSTSFTFVFTCWHRSSILGCKSVRTKPFQTDWINDKVTGYWVDSGLSAADCM